MKIVNGLIYHDDIPGWGFTRHALERAADMCVGAELLAECLHSPEATYPCPCGETHERPRQHWVKRSIVLVVEQDLKAVFTVLWYDPEKPFVRSVTEDLKRIRDKQ